MNNECTHHIQQREGPWVAPGSSPGVGGCSDQVSRHHLRRSHWYIRSKRLILSSLITSGIPTIAAAQSSQITGSYVAISSLTTCVALDAGALFRLIVGISLLVVPSILLCLLIWHGLILPRLEDYLDRRLHRQLDQGKLPPLSASRLRELWYRNPRPWKVQP